MIAEIFVGIVVEGGIELGHVSDYAEEVSEDNKHVDIFFFITNGANIFFIIKPLDIASQTANVSFFPLSKSFSLNLNLLSSLEKISSSRSKVVVVIFVVLDLGSKSKRFLVVFPR